ncbi:MAG: GGDEF domain-containing protein [Desulfobacterales bacterium]
MREDKGTTKVNRMEKTLWTPSAKEISIVIVFAVAGTLLMAFLDAYERLYLFTQMYELSVFDDFAVFLPSFLAMGFSLFAYRQIQKLELEVGRREQAEIALRESEERYKIQSITDELTQLYNSRHFYGELKKEIDRNVRHGGALSLVLLDIDDFKSYNDTYGHLEGDAVLSRLGKVIRSTTRQIDTGFRYGGEEFTVVLAETNIEQASIVAERIRKAFEAETFFPNSDDAKHITMSLGVSEYAAGEKLESFVKRADEAMYVAKEQGKNRVHLG